MSNFNFNTKYSISKAKHVLFFVKKHVLIEFNSVNELMAICSRMTPNPIQFNPWRVIVIWADNFYWIMYYYVVRPKKMYYYVDQKKCWPKKCTNKIIKRKFIHPRARMTLAYDSLPFSIKKERYLHI